METYVRTIISHTPFLKVEYVLVVQMQSETDKCDYRWKQINVGYTTWVTYVVTREASVCVWDATCRPELVDVEVNGRAS